MWIAPEIIEIDMLLEEAPEDGDGEVMMRIAHYLEEGQEGHGA